MEYSRFFNSTTDDKRVYTAEDFAEFMSAFYSSGVIGEGLKVSKTGLNTITVSPGEAIIEGYYYKNTEDITLTLTGLNDKTIVLFLDKSIGKRNIKVTQIDGNSVQSGYVDTQKEKFYLPIAKVTMKSSNEIAEISDRRTYCDGLFSVDLTEFRAQAEDAVNEIKTMSAEAVGDILSTAGGLPISSGGTGATNAEDARNYLGAAAESHNHSASDITSGMLSIARGGTGASTRTEAQATLGVPTTHNCTVLSANVSTIINKQYYTDFDTMTDAGIYYIPAVSTNYSVMANFEVLNGWLIVMPNKTAPATCVKQIFLRLGTADVNNHQIFERLCINSVWSTWAKIYTSKDTLPIVNGGTGAKTASASFKALSEDTGWKTLVFTSGQYWRNGATNKNASFKPVEYRKVGSQVFIDGFFECNDPNNSFEGDYQKTLFKLPADCCPNKRVYCRLPMSGNQYAKVYILENGTVGMDGTSATDFSGLWFNFNNVSFFVD